MNAKTKAKILVADDHQLFLDGIVTLLKHEPGIEICGTAANGAVALEKLSKSEYDICLLDISMPMMDGFDLVKELRLRKIKTKIIILTSHNNRELFTSMVLNGISGYILKSASREELMEAIREVYEGRTYFTKEIQAAGQHATSVPPAPMFTPREIEIIRLLADENTNDMIAEKLFISYRTVETHRKNIMHKAKAKNIAGLMKFAHENKLI